MDFTDSIFVDGDIKDLNTIIYSLKKGIPVFNIYLICVERKSRHIAHIMSSGEYFSKRNVNCEYKTIGIAAGKQGGLSAFWRCDEILG